MYAEIRSIFLMNATTYSSVTIKFAGSALENACLVFCRYEVRASAFDGDLSWVYLSLQKTAGIVSKLSDDHLFLTNFQTTT
jgi:hypothetical protein